MKYVNEFNRIMETTNEIALATAVDNIPNVRIINFYYDTDKKGIVYFATFKNSAKTQEFLQSNLVSFTTVPIGTSEHIRVNGNLQKSELTIYDLKDAFIKKLPSYEITIEKAGHVLDLYEIHFNEASVILDINDSGKINF